MSDPFADLRDALSGRYSLERELGRGGMATVYLATDLKHGREVAIKVLDPELASSGGGDRFLREIEIAARLKHPHILSLIDSGESGGLYYFVMPYVEGKSLRDRLEREKQLPIEEAIEITREVADGLGYAHRQGVIHRDIKPANILLSEGHALIADFGVARALEAEGQGLTRTGMAVGTPQYMSPEQATGTEEVDERSDLYALGCVLYEMLAGAPPLVGPTAQATAGMRLTETATALPVLRDTVPGGLDRVTQKLLAKAPADRYPTAEKLGQALASPDIWASGKKKRSAGQKLLDAAIAIVLLALGGYATTWFAGRGSEEIVPIVGDDLVPDLIAVIPFQVTDLDPRESAAIPGYIRRQESMTITGYIRALYLDWGHPERVADPTEVERLWEEAGGEISGDISRRKAVDVGRSVEAWYTLIGEVRRTDDSVALSAYLLSNHNGVMIAFAELTGSPDSLRELAQRAMIALTGQLHGFDEEQSAILSQHDPRAVGLYFDGWFDEAIAIDSTFAMAALAKHRMGEHSSESDRIAWEFRDRLTREDRALIEAFLTPYFDTTATAERQRDLWRAAWELDPNDQDATFEYAEEIVKWNGLLPQWVLGHGRGLSWTSLLQEVLSRLCQLCGIGPYPISPEVDALNVAARLGQAEWIRGYFEQNPAWLQTSEDDAYVARPAFGRWLLALAEGDSVVAAEAADSVLEQSRRLRHDDGDRWLIPEETLLLMSVLTGWTLPTAERIASRRAAMGGFPGVRAAHFVRERGRHDAYRSLRGSAVTELRARLRSTYYVREMVFEWVYYNEPESEETIDFLDSALEREVREAEDPIDRGSALCWRAQLRLHRDAGADVSEAIRVLSEDSVYAPLAVSRMCAPFLRLLVAVNEGSDVMPALKALDGVVSRIPLDGWDRSLFREDGQLELLRAANLTIARILRESGLPGEALHVLQRRPDSAGAYVASGNIGDALGFTADYLREEAPLYAVLGDTVMAIERYEHYFRLREERPEFEAWAAQWDSARAELEALMARQ